MDTTTPHQAEATTPKPANDRRTASKKASRLRRKQRKRGQLPPLEPDVEKYGAGYLLRQARLAEHKFLGTATDLPQLEKRRRWRNNSKKKQWRAVKAMKKEARGKFFLGLMARFGPGSTQVKRDGEGAAMEEMEKEFQAMEMGEEEEDDEEAEGEGGWDMGPIAFRPKPDENEGGDEGEGEDEDDDDEDEDEIS